ncbi:hypothetical protein DFP72DRAFT_84503 [Ephemerocybe angulata]|uniref:Uncharacterized protein n=1 Tax=Ephemerocybe angulata TaxID=980116 RepID=A0A8H6LW27_9AGAR|nr:hypothetical protein DFP72DRAFT_84503 [Tulosesus angulatus]
MHPHPSVLRRRTEPLLPVPPPEAGPGGSLSSLSPRTLSASQLQLPPLRAASFYPPTSFDPTSRVSATSPARKPLRSSPLAGPALSTPPGQRQAINTTSTPNLHTLYARFAHRNTASDDLPPPLAIPPPSPAYHHHHPNASSSTVASQVHATRKKLVKRFQHGRASTTPSIMSSAPPASSRESLSLSLSPPMAIPLTRIKTVEGADRIAHAGFNSAEIPRFTRQGLRSRNVVMPLSPQEYERKRRESAVSATLSPSTGRTRPPPPVLSPDSTCSRRLRSRSCTQVEQDVFLLRFQQAPLQRDEETGEADGSPFAGLDRARRAPSPAQSSSTDSGSDAFPFTPTPSVSSISSAISELHSHYPYPCNSVSLVGRDLKGAPEGELEGQALTPILVSDVLRGRQRYSDDGSSTWSQSDDMTTTTTTTATTWEGSDVSVPGGDVEQRKRKGGGRSLKRLLVRTFSRRRFAGTGSAA